MNEKDISLLARLSEFFEQRMPGQREETHVVRSSDAVAEPFNVVVKWPIYFFLEEPVVVRRRRQSGGWLNRLVR